MVVLIFWVCDSTGCEVLSPIPILTFSLSLHVPSMHLLTSVMSLSSSSSVSLSFLYISLSHPSSTYSSFHPTPLSTLLPVNPSHAVVIVMRPSCSDGCPPPCHVARCGEKMDGMVVIWRRQKASARSWIGSPRRPGLSGMLEHWMLCIHILKLSLSIRHVYFGHHPLPATL